jgi:hypothetical protein
MVSSLSPVRKIDIKKGSLSEGQLAAGASRGRQFISHQERPKYVKHHGSPSLLVIAAPADAEATGSTRQKPYSGR